MSEPSSSESESRPASIALPLRLSLKRPCTPSQTSLPSKRRYNSNGNLLRSFDDSFTQVVEQSTSGWTALKVELPAREEEDGVEVEPEEENHKSIPDSHGSVTSSSPSESRFHDLSVAGSSRTITPVASLLSKAVPLAASNSKAANDLWIIDGFDVRSIINKTSKTRFTPKQESKILLWMKVNEAKGVAGNPISFHNLIAELGFAGKGHSKEVENALRLKVRLRMNNFYATLKRKGIVEDVEACPISRQENSKIKFAAYTDTWLRPNWNGSTELPSSWLAETIEVDHEVGEHDDPDNVPDRAIVASPPPQKKQKQSTRVVQHPVVNILDDVKEYWTEEIIGKKLGADREVKKNVWKEGIIRKADWNIAAVQAQYAGIDMSKKILLEEALDDLLDSSASSQYGIDIPGLSSPQTPLSEITRAEPDGFYADIDSADESSIPQSQTQKRIIPLWAHPSSFCETIGSHETQAGSDRSGLSGRHPVSAHDFDDQEDANVVTDEIEDELIEDDFADEEDNVDDENGTDMMDANLPAPLTGITSTFPSTDSESLVSPREAIAAQQAAKKITEYTLAVCNGVPYEIIPLTCATYRRWKHQLHALLLVHDAWGVISGDLQSPISKSFSDGEDFRKELSRYKIEAEEWRKKMRISLGWMLLTMGSETRDFVTCHGIQDPIELWALLKDEFEVEY